MRKDVYAGYDAQEASDAYCRAWLDSTSATPDEIHKAMMSNYVENGDHL